MKYLTVIVCFLGMTACSDKETVVKESELTKEECYALYNQAMTDTLDVLNRSTTKSNRNRLAKLRSESCD